MSRELQFYWNNIRAYGVHLLIMVALVTVTVKVLLPQFENALLNRAQLLDNRTKLETLTGKVKFLESLDKTSSRQKLQRLNWALPVEKDVGLMLTALERAASRENVELGSFSFSVGIIATSSATTTTAKSGTALGVPSIEVTLNVRGDIDEVARFINGLGRALPVMRVGGVSISERLSTVTLSYYFKPLISGKTSAAANLPQITKKQEDVFKRILEREMPIVAQIESPPADGAGDQTGLSSSRTDPFH